MSVRWLQPVDGEVVSVQTARWRTAKLPSTDPVHPVYPHSIVNAGVYTPGELEEAVREDPVARAHYAVLQRPLRTEKLPEGRRAFVSYRIAKAVFWTRKPVALPGGEAVITDGVRMVRARCGNRIEDTPQEPVTLSEPPEIEFETPLSPPHPLALIPQEPPPPVMEIVPPGAPSWEASSWAADKGPVPMGGASVPASPPVAGGLSVRDVWVPFGGSIFPPYAATSASGQTGSVYMRPEPGMYTPFPPAPQQTIVITSLLLPELPPTGGQVTMVPAYPPPVPYIPPTSIIVPPAPAPPRVPPPTIFVPDQPPSPPGPPPIFPPPTIPVTDEPGPPPQPPGPWTPPVPHFVADAVPEPATWTLIVTGMLLPSGAAAIRRR